MFLTAGFAAAQNPQFPAPREQKLLNGLKLLVWNEPSAAKTTVKLRIHSGSAFDPENKMGVAALLGDILFPTDQAKAFFTEDLEGSLEVTSNYDYIQISATGNSAETLAMIETLARAVVNPQITDENFKLVRDARLKKIQEFEKNPAYVADRAVAKRLFGNFPYGRSADGTVESLAKIDRADLLFAKERFLTADNATMVIIGNVKPDYAYRAARQLFGAWTKADKKVPPTFRQPDAPPREPELINAENTETAEIRTASRGLARNDKDFPALQILLPILQEKWTSVQLPAARQNAFVRHQAHFLPGIFIIGTNVPKAETTNFMKILETSGKAMESFTEADFEKNKANVIADFNKKSADSSSSSEMWLDVETFKLAPVAEQFRALQNVQYADVKRVGDNFFETDDRVLVLVYKQNGAQANNK